VLELDASIGGGEAPVNAGAGVVPLLLPRRGFAAERPVIGKPSVEALAGDDGKFDLWGKGAASLLPPPLRGRLGSSCSM
jgi:hypothetical protein